MTLVAFNSTLIVTSVFGMKWLEAVPIIKILCFAGAFQSITQFSSAVFASIGKPEVNSYIAFIRVVMTILAILIGSIYGIMGVAYLLFLSKLLDWIITHAVLKKFIKYDLAIIWKYLEGIVICLFFLGVSECIIQFVFNFHVHTLLKFFLQVCLALVIIISFYKVILYKMVSIIFKPHKNRINLNMKMDHCIDRSRAGGTQRTTIELPIQQKKQDLEGSMIFDKRKWTL